MRVFQDNPTNRDNKAALFLYSAFLDFSKFILSSTFHAIYPQNYFVSLSDVEYFLEWAVHCIAHGEPYHSSPNEQAAPLV
jgi:hypothetical protein